MRTLLCRAVATCLGGLIGLGCQVNSPGSGAFNQSIKEGDKENDEDKADPARALESPPNPKWTRDDEALIAPIWTGNDQKGQLYAPLFRGALPGMEELVFTPQNGDCRVEHSAKGTVRLDWDAAKNTLHYLIKGARFDPHPTVHRTENVDWWFNPFHPAPKDFTDGAYRLWTVTMSTKRNSTLYYDPHTLKLLGTNFNFASPPPAIPLQFPVFSITGSKQMSPDEKGFFAHEFTVPYSGVTVEGGLFSQDWVSFAPQDLCEAAPFQPAISQLRPVASPWQPAASAPTWAQMLSQGIGLDFHAEERADPKVLDGNLPYVYSGVSVVSNFASMQGGVPNGWHAAILPAILNVGPPIEPVPHGGNNLGCTAYVNENHVHAPRYCEMAH